MWKYNVKAALELVWQATKDKVPVRPHLQCARKKQLMASSRADARGTGALHTLHPSVIFRRKFRTPMRGKQIIEANGFVAMVLTTQRRSNSPGQRRQVRLPKMVENKRAPPHTRYRILG